MNKGKLFAFLLLFIMVPMCVYAEEDLIDISQAVVEGGIFITPEKKSYQNI